MPLKDIISPKSKSKSASKSKPIIAHNNLKAKMQKVTPAIM
jgi:hypothetical protein